MPAQARAARKLKCTILRAARNTTYGVTDLRIYSPVRRQRQGEGHADQHRARATDLPGQAAGARVEKPGAVPLARSVGVEIER